MCLQNFEEGKIVEVEYRRIFNILSDNPIPIYNLHPKISKEDIEKLRKKRQFLEKKAVMCFECYINLTDHKNLKNIVSLPLIGTGPLNPSKIKAKKNHGFSSTRYSSLEVLSSISSFLPNSLVSPSTVTNTSMPKAIFSARTSKTAGGELIISFPSSRNHY